MADVINNMHWFRKPLDSEELTSLLRQAEELAVSYGHDYIGVEHIFLTFRSLPSDHKISETLAVLHLDLAAFYKELEGEAKVVVTRPKPSKLSYTPRMMTILRCSRQMARMNHYMEVTCFHLFHSIGYEGESIPGRLLRKYFVSSNPDYTPHHFNASILAGHLAFSRKPEIMKLPKL